MAQFQKMSEEESLRRSHSGVSNFKLTLVCLLLAFSLTLLVASLATLGTDVLPSAIATVGLIVGAVLSVGSFFLISRFKR